MPQYCPLNKKRQFRLAPPTTGFAFKHTTDARDLFLSALTGQVCVVGDDVRVHERPSLPDLPSGLMGSFAFDSQKPYPTLEEVRVGFAGGRAVDTRARQAV